MLIRTVLKLYFLGAYNEPFVINDDRQTFTLFCARSIFVIQGVLK